MKITAFITVRSKSTRLPGKCFLPFGEGTVLDEATSSLDVDTERYVMKSIEEL